MGATGHVRPRVAVFCSELLGYGGAERVVFEEAVRLGELGFDTRIVAIRYARPASFEGFYRAPVDVLRLPWRASSAGGLIRYLAAVVALTGWLMRSKPNLVMAMSTNECALLLIPSILTRTRYMTHINGTVFWFPNEQNLTKYALLYRRAFSAIARASPSMREFVPLERPALALVKRIRLETSAVLHWLAVRRASERISFSERMAWEVRLLYGRSAVCLKGAFPRRMLGYKPTTRPLDAFRRNGGPIIFNANRLEPRKRVALAIRAFATMLRAFPDATLVIAGEGGQREALERLSKELGVAQEVRFVGFVPEAELWDWLASSDVFVHPNWAEFAIAPFEALALARKVVWSTEMEMDESVARTGLVYPAEPTVSAMANAIEAALRAPRAVPDLRKLDAFSWESYFEKLSSLIHARLD
jgi:glycosyltransferase involved in cell wall biosynthesis